MVMLLRKLLHSHQIAGQEIIFVFLWFLPFLAAQNQYSNSENTRCLESVTRCFNARGTEDADQFYLQNMKTILHEHEKKLCHKLKAMYHNITENMEQLCQPQSTANTDMHGLGEAIGSIKDKLEDLVISQEATEHNMIHTQEELNECKEKLAKFEQTRNFSEEIEELKSLIKAMLAEQKGTEQMNELRHLIRQRYNETDVVNAARENDINKLRLLLDAGMKVDSKDPAYYSNTPLHVAAHKGQLEMIKFLTERGAPLEARNADSNTPFIDAAAGGSIPAAKLLLELGANAKAKGWHGETALDRARREGQKEFIDWLTRQH